MSHFTVLLGETLCKNTKNETVNTASALEGKYVGLYFSAHWCPPCRGFTPVLSEWYTALREDMDRTDFELIFVSSDKDEEQWKEYFDTMPFLGLSFADRDRKAQLSKKYKVSGIPTLVFLSPDGKLLTANGRDKVQETKSNPTFKFEDWKPKTFWQALGDKDLVTKEGKTTIASLKEQEAIGIYFSAHWCPPCRKFTPELASIYNKLRSDGKKFEIIFVSGDKDQSSFDEYLNDMPWSAIPFGDPRLKSFNSMYDVEGIPTLIIVGPDGKTITEDGRSSVGSDIPFPWYPPLVGELDGSAASFINDTPVMVLFTKASNKDNAVATLTPLAEQVKANTKEDEDPSMKVVWAGDHPIVQRVVDVCQIAPRDSDYLVMLDLSEGMVYQHPDASVKVDAESVKAFADAFTAGALEGKKLQ